MLLLVRCRYLEVTHHRMPTAVTLILAQPFIALAVLGVPTDGQLRAPPPSACAARPVHAAS